MTLLAGRGAGLVTVLAPLAMGLVIAAAVIALDGKSPLVIFKAFEGTLFRANGLLQTLATATPLVLTGLTFALAFRCGLFNIGAEGAVFMGAGASLAVGAFLPLPPGLHLLVVIASAMAAGALWLLPVALLKAKRHVHEVVSTIMLNYIARFLLSFIIAWQLKDRTSGIGSTATKILPSGQFPVLSSPLTVALFLAILAALGVHFLLSQLRLGAHFRAAGYNSDAARAAGVKVERMNALAFALGGALAGLAGCALTAGLAPQFTIADDLSAVRNFGALGIAVAMIGRNHPIGCIFAAFFVATVRTARFQFQKQGVTPEVTDLFIGVVIFAFAFPEIHRSLASWIAAWRRRRAAHV